MGTEECVSEAVVIAWEIKSRVRISPMRQIFSAPVGVFICVDR